MMRGFFICIFILLKKILQIIIPLLFFASCKNAEEEVAVPDYVLDKEKFSDLLVDFSLAEAAAGTNILNVPGTRGDTVYAFNPLLDHNIKRVTFDTSIYFYCHHPKMFKEVYALTLEKLSKFQASRK